MTPRTAAPDDALDDATDPADETDGHVPIDEAVSGELESAIADALNEMGDDEGEGAETLEDAPNEDEDAGNEEAAEGGESEAGAEGEGAEAATTDGAQPRDAQGKFAKKDDAAPEGAKPDADAAATEKPAEGAAPAAPQWQALSVTENQTPVAIDEARIAEVGDHMFIAVPKEKFAQFQQRIVQGLAGQRYWRDLQKGIREVEALKSAPAPKGDAEIEAEIVLDALRPHLPTLLDERDQELLTARIELAKTKAKQEFAATEAARMAKATEKPWEEVQTEGIQSEIRALRDAYPELKPLTDAHLSAMYQQEFLPIKDALVFQREGKPYSNRQYLYDRLKAAATHLSTAGPSSSTAAPSGTAGASPAQSPTNASAPKPPVDKAERFNRGVDANRPTTTSAKANRTARPASGANRTPAKPPARVSAHERRVAAEDRLRREQRAFMNSASLDYSLDDEDDV